VLVLAGFWVAKVAPVQLACLAMVMVTVMLAGKATQARIWPSPRTTHL
jgi:hypothetical protein